MSLLSSARSLGKSILPRLVAAFHAASAFFGRPGLPADPFAVAAAYAPVTTFGTTPGYGQQPTPMKRTRVPGKARPSGSKLARKAANGTIGLTH